MALHYFILKFFVLVAVFARANSGPTQAGSTVDVCDPCGSLRLDFMRKQDLQMHLRWSVYMEYFAIREAVSAAKERFNVDLDPYTLDLTECCGSSYAVSPSDLKLRSVKELVVDAMLNVNDIIRLNMSPKKLGTSLERLNTTLCVIQHLESSQPTLKSSPRGCEIQSQISTCTGGQKGHSKTCDVKMTFTFFLNALEILKHLIVSRRIN